MPTPFYVIRGLKMDIRAKIERVRSLAETLQNWDAIIKDKRLDAIYGRRFGFDEIKVQHQPKKDRMLKAIIDVQEAEERKQMIVDRYWSEKQETMAIIEKFAKVDDLTPLHRYLIGFELEQIPLTGRQKNPKAVIDGAIKRLQKVLNTEEEITKQPQAVQNLIRGGKKKCKCCKEGFIYYKKEEADKFLFACDCCNKMYKAQKAKFL